MLGLNSSERIEVEEGVIIAPSMYWSVVPQGAYAMRTSTSPYSLYAARLRRIRQLRDRKAKEKKYER